MKILISTLVTLSVAFGANLNYKISAPLFGEVGEVNINYINSSSKYSIKANLRTYGLTKQISGNRVEHYTSTGSISNNIYYAKKFSQTLKYKNKKSTLKYIFNYQKKEILKKRKKWVDGNLKTNYSKALPYFTYNDLFSAYHNIITQLRGKKAGSYKIKTAGMEKYGGYLIVKIPPKTTQDREAESMGVNDVWVFHIVTRKKILKSKNGEIIFAVGSDGVAKAVRIIDIPMVSHLDAKLSR